MTNFFTLSSSDSKTNTLHTAINLSVEVYTKERLMSEVLIDVVLLIVFGSKFDQKFLNFFKKHACGDPVKMLICMSEMLVSS